MENEALRNALMRLMQMYPEQTTPLDSRIQHHRAQARSEEAMGFNALQRLLGLNLSPNVGVNRMVQPELAPQNRISETFRQMPGYY
jgi:hypothetical protein